MHKKRIQMHLIELMMKNCKCKSMSIKDQLHRLFENKNDMSAADWLQFQEALHLKTAAIEQLKAMADAPSELIWAEPIVWNELLSTGMINAVQICRLRHYFDDWTRLNVRLSLSESQLADLEKTFPLPSALLAEADPIAACEKLQFSRITAARIVRGAQQGRVDDGVTIGAVRLAAAAAASVDFDASENGIIWRAPGLLEEADAKIVARMDLEREKSLFDAVIVRSFAAMLRTYSALSNNAPNVVFLHLGRGSLSLVEPIHIYANAEISALCRPDLESPRSRSG